MTVFKSLVESAPAVVGAKEGLSESVVALFESQGGASRFKAVAGLLESSKKGDVARGKAIVRVMENFEKHFNHAKAQLSEATVQASLGSMASLTPRVLDIVGCEYQRAA